MIMWDNDGRNPIVSGYAESKNDTPITTRVHAIVMLAVATLPEVPTINA